MQPGIADVITVAKAAAQLRTAVVRTGVVIGTLHHIHTPDAVTGLQFFWVKARRRAENTSRGFDENAGNYRYFTYASWVLSAASALVALVPFVYIWKILRDVLNVAPD